MFKKNSLSRHCDAIVLPGWSVVHSTGCPGLKPMYSDAQLVQDPSAKSSEL